MRCPATTQTSARAQECQDEDAVEDGLGRQELFRTVRIPFRVAVVTGNLKLRMHVTQSWPDGSVRCPCLHDPGPAWPSHWMLLRSWSMEKRARGARCVAQSMETPHMTSGALALGALGCTIACWPLAGGCCLMWHLKRGCGPKRSAQRGGVVRGSHQHCMAFVASAAWQRRLT